VKAKLSHKIGEFEFFKSKKEFLETYPEFKRWERFYDEVARLSTEKGVETHAQILTEYPDKKEIWVYGSGDEDIVRQACANVFGKDYKAMGMSGVKPELPEGVVLVKFEMKNEKYAEMVSTIFDAIASGDYEFRSAVHLKDMMRTVMYKKGAKTGTPIEVYAKDKDVAWSLQQTIDWAYNKIIKVVATRREGNMVEVAYIKVGLAPPPPKEKCIYSFKKTDGWKLVGEEK